MGHITKENGASTSSTGEDLRLNRMKRMSVGSKRDKEMDSVNFISKTQFMKETFETERKKGKGS